jgi:Tfp pilus assembly protein PilV
VFLDEEKKMKIKTSKKIFSTLPLQTAQVRCNSGLSLLELVLAMTVLSFVMLGGAAMEVPAAKMAQNISDEIKFSNKVEYVMRHIEMNAANAQKDSVGPTEIVTINDIGTNLTDINRVLTVRDTSVTPNRIIKYEYICQSTDSTETGLLLNCDITNSLKFQILDATSGVPIQDWLTLSADKSALLPYVPLIDYGASTVVDQCDQAIRQVCFEDIGQDEFNTVNGNYSCGLTYAGLGVGLTDPGSGLCENVYKKMAFSSTSDNKLVEVNFRVEKNISGQKIRVPVSKSIYLHQSGGG